jgi:hypothetical protein
MNSDFLIINYFFIYRISIERLQAMAQMHSYLVINAKSELKYLNEEITLDELDETFNQIALSMENGSDLFDDDEVNEIDFIPDDDYEYDDEIIDLEGVNNDNLEINNYIDLTASIIDPEAINSNEEDEVSIIHGDPDFDIDEMVNKFSINID